MENIKKTYSNKETLKENIKKYQLLEKNGVNTIDKIVEIRENEIIYSRINGIAFLEDQSIDIKDCYKLGVQVGKLHSIDLSNNSKTKPIFYQIQMIKRLNQISKNLKDDRIDEIVKYIDKALEKVSFRDIKLGFTIQDLEKEDIILGEDGNVYLFSEKDFLYGNQEMNFCILKNIKDNRVVVEFFKGYTTEIQIDRDMVSRMKIFNIFNILQKTTQNNLEKNICFITKIIEKTVGDIYKNI